MPILKSFFASSNGQVPTTAAAAPPVEPHKSRAPSVVARLMGLDMLPPETVQPRKKQVDENAMQGSKGTKQSNAAAGRPSRSSPLEPVTKLNLGDQYQTRKSQELRQQEADMDCLRTIQKSQEVRQQEADCLKTIRLEELNKQLLMKHMRVLDELSRAKQLVTDSLAAEKQQQPRRGLSDTTEYMDALELLEANRQFFKKYFRSSEVKSVATAISKPDPGKLPAAKGPKASYLRNGQSSPRPPPVDSAANLEIQKPIVVLKPRSLLTSESYGQLRGPDAAEILSKAGTNTRQLVSKALEKPSSNDAKDLAKLIAKRIKEGIAKEVAKTFTSSAHSSELLQSDTPGKYSLEDFSNRSGEIGRRNDSRERSPRTSKSAAGESQSPRSKRLSAESGQAESPRTRNKSSSTDAKVEPKKNASPEADQRMKVDGRKTAPNKSRSYKPAGSSSKAGSRANSEVSSKAKPVSSRQAVPAPPNSGPKVLDRSPTLPSRYRNTTAGISKGVLKERKQSQKSLSNNSSRSTGSRTVPEQETTAARTSEEYLELPIDLKAQEPSAEVNRLEENLGTSLTALETVTPAKEAGALNAAGTTTECSPVSVLDVNVFNEDETEHVKEVISEQGICVSTAGANKIPQLQEQPPLTTTVEAAIGTLEEQESRQDEKQEKLKEDEARVAAREEDIVIQAVKDRTRQLQVELTEAITCPVDRQEELSYLRDLIAASDLELDGRPAAGREFSLDSSLFEKLEEQYSQEQACEELVDRVKVHARAVKRWLVFDLTNEVLATPAWKHKVQTGRGLVEELWSSILDHSRQLKESESLDSLVEAEMGSRCEWTEAKDEVMELFSDVEVVIFKELVEEAIQDLVSW